LSLLIQNHTQDRFADKSLSGPCRLMPSLVGVGLYYSADTNLRWPAIVLAHSQGRPSNG
jgi:hypothetical protein